MNAHASPRSAYLHVPFCAHRCGYCNFSVLAGRDELAPAYVDALAMELYALARPREVDTLYIGGGTPTRAPRDELNRLCALARTWFPPAPGVEWTVEANPEDVTGDLVLALAEHGVTRVSLGAQSFDADKLTTLERSHSAADVNRSVELCREAGLDVSVDLIFAAPGETLEGWRRDVAAVAALAPDHVSTYGLTYEKGTKFWNRLRRGDLTELPDGTQREMYLFVIDRLTAAGYEHYEVSNFARPGSRSRHNQAYWTGRGWYAAGCGAARYVAGVRETNHRSPTTYMRRVLAGESPVAEREVLTPEQRARERLVFGLRRLEGVQREEFAEETGYKIDQLAGAAIARFVELGLLEADKDAVRLTREGLLVSDAMWPEIV